jgi:hypothetical protein
MLAINNQQKFNATVKEALTKSANFPRWQNAIGKAVAQIELHGEFMTWMPETKSLLIWSQDSNDIHAANGVCDCEAFKRGFPCWHRAAARLVRLYMEARLDEGNNIPYLKPTIERKAERVGGIRIN